MTAKQILDAFSETLMQDERILIPRERELVMSLLQNSKAVSSGSSPEIQSAVTAAIARSVGETVAHRAFAVLGGSIVEQILAHSGIPAGTEESMSAPRPQLQAPQPPSPPARRSRQAARPRLPSRRAHLNRPATRPSPRVRLNRRVARLNPRARLNRPAVSGH
jgi:hypothetical protein